jgi:hypothetical protein
MARGEKVMHRLIERSQPMGGTCAASRTGRAEFGAEALKAMRIEIDLSTP